MKSWLFKLYSILRRQIKTLDNAQNRITRATARFNAMLAEVKALTKKHDPLFEYRIAFRKYLPYVVCGVALFFLGVCCGLAVG